MNDLYRQIVGTIDNAITFEHVGSFFCCEKHGGKTSSQIRWFVSADLSGLPYAKVKASSEHLHLPAAHSEWQL